MQDGFVPSRAPIHMGPMNWVMYTSRISGPMQPECIRPFSSFFILTRDRWDHYLPIRAIDILFLQEARVRFLFRDLYISQEILVWGASINDR